MFHIKCYVYNLAVYDCFYRISYGEDGVLDPDQSGIQNVTVGYHGDMVNISFVRTGHDESDISVEGPRYLTLMKTDLQTNATTTIDFKETSLKGIN